MTDNPVANRTVGDYPLSIALSLALEGIQGRHPDRPTGKNLLPKYDVAWVNLKTMFRNLFNALEKEATLTVLPGELIDGLMQEMDQFSRIIESETKSKMEVIYYLPEYSGMSHAYPHAFLRTDNTTNQLMYAGLQKVTLDAISLAMGKALRHYDRKITDTEARKALLLTHCPIDLFTKTFQTKALWESHTGSVKEKHQWYTKYFNGRDLTMIPFREDFIQIFGDNEHFRPMSIGIRKEIIALALKYGWSHVTTRDKIIYTLENLENKDTLALIRSIMH